MMTPRLFTVSAVWTVTPETQSDVTVLILLRLVASCIASDFDGLSASPLCSSHSWTLTIHRSSVLRFTSTSSFEIAMYSCCLLYTYDAADEEDSVDLGG